jgi:hypothetical protein
LTLGPLGGNDEASRQTLGHLGHAASIDRKVSTFKRLKASDFVKRHGGAGVRVRHFANSITQQAKAPTLGIGPEQEPGQREPCVPSSRYWANAGRSGGVPGPKGRSSSFIRSCARLVSRERV